MPKKAFLNCHLKLSGVDNIGTYSFTGIVAGDEETYEVNLFQNFYKLEKITTKIQFFCLNRSSKLYLIK